MQPSTCDLATGIRSRHRPVTVLKRLGLASTNSHHLTKDVAQSRSGFVMLCNAHPLSSPPLFSSLGSSCLSSLPCRVPLHRQPLSDLQHQHQRDPVPAQVGKQQQVVRSDGEHSNKESCHRHLGAKLCTCCIGTWGVGANNRRHVRVAVHATCRMQHQYPWFR